MLAAKTTLIHAEEVKNILIKKNILDHRYLPIKEFGVIFFPLLKKVKIPKAEIIDVAMDFPKKPLPLTIEGLLKNKLSAAELKKIPKSQEIIGTILILEIPEELEHHEKKIAEAYLQLNKHIETVVKKAKMHEGTYRTRKVKVLAGKKKKETLHLESGIKLKLHLEKTYFSARSANERMRIAQLVKPGEEILVMFSGAAPYPLVLARHTPAKIIYGIELNPSAHQYALQNVELNNLQSKVIIYQGDVRKIVPSMRQNFDRIIMPLPKTSEEFLDVALPKAKKKGMIHLYAFFNEKNLAEETKKIEGICHRLNYNVKIIRTVKCGQFSPGTFRWCFDLMRVS